MAIPILFKPITKLAERLGNIGIDYSIIKETNSITYEDDLYKAYSSWSRGHEDTYEDNSYSKSSYNEKRKYLRKFSTYPEIEYILDCVCDDSVITNEFNRYCEIKFTNEKYQKDVKESIMSFFEDVYSLLDFDGENVAWKKYRQWLIDGCLSYEILYEYKTKAELNDQIIKLKKSLVSINENLKLEKDDKERVKVYKGQVAKVQSGLDKIQSLFEMYENSKFYTDGTEKEDIYPVKIIGFVEIDPNRLKYVDIRDLSENQKKIKGWEYVKTDGSRVTLSENQILYIPYLDIDTTGNLSYVERLLRDFNLKRKLEDATVGWFIMNCQSRIKMVVPVGNKTTDKALEALRKFVNHFKETLLINFDSGEVTVNGQPSISYSRNIVVPSVNGSQSQIDTLKQEGPDLTNMKVVDYFNGRLNEISRLPTKRFDRADNNGGGKVIFYADDNLSYEDLSYFNFINRMMTTFNQVLSAPIYINCMLKHKELKADKSFRTSFGIKHNANFLIEDAKQTMTVKKKLDMIKLYEAIKNDKGQPMYSQKYLYIDKFAIMTLEEFEKNKTMIEEESPHTN